MTKKNIIKFPDYNDKFKNNSGQQYFLKDSQKIKYYIPEKLKKQNIKKGENIFLPYCVDTEFSKYVGDAINTTLEELAENKNKFLLQKNMINSTLLNKDFFNIEDISP